MKVLRSAEEWEARFDAAFQRYRELCASTPTGSAGPRAVLKADLMALGLSEGDALCWMGRRAR